MAIEASSQGLKKWVVVGAAAGVLGCGFSAFLLFGPPRWGGVPLAVPPLSNPVSIGVSDVSAGMSTGFTRPRPAMRKNEDLKAVLPEWCHLVAKGDQSLSPPSIREAWYDILVGPSDAAVPNVTPAQIEGHFSNPHLRLDNGIGYLSGRWIIPRTRRIRGVSPGGNLYGAVVAGGAPPEDPIDPASCVFDDEQVIEGRIVVFTDKTRDIVFFAPDATPATMTLVLKQWKPGSTNPRDEEPPLADTLFDCLQINSGNYYIVTYDAGLKKLIVATKSWSLTNESHDADVKEIITRVNTKVGILNHLTVVKRLPVLTP